MDDKIFNINDYKKNKEKKEVNNPPKPPEEIDAGDISIEDPFIFLNAEERKQYMLEHQHDIADDSNADVENNGSENAADEQMPEDDSEACDSDDRNDEYDREEHDDDHDDDYDREEHDDDRDDDYDREERDDDRDDDYDRDDRDDRGFMKRKRSALFHKTDDVDMEPDDYSDDSNPDEDEDINQSSDGYDDYNNDENIEDDTPDNNHKYRMIKIASTVTGILIIAVIALIVKIRFVDPILSAGEGTDTGVASASTAVSGESVVTTHDLNLRTSEDSSSKDNIAATVSAGTTLIRISEDNGWSEVSYNGQTLYCATKYLTVQ